MQYASLCISCGVLHEVTVWLLCGYCVVTVRLLCGYCVGVHFLGETVSNADRLDSHFCTKVVDLTRLGPLACASSSIALWHCIAQEHWSGMLHAQ